MNGQSFVLRRKESPFTYLFFDSNEVTKNKVENLEKRLKKDIFAESRNVMNQSNIIIHDECELQTVLAVFKVLYS